MFEALSPSFTDNFLWIAACFFVVTVTKIALDIFEKRSTRSILKDAECQEREKEDELQRRIEQASRRLRSNNSKEVVGLAPNPRLLH